MTRDKLDERLVTAFYDVPIPSGLAQRLLEGIENSAASTACESSNDSSPSLLLRRRLLVVLGGVAVAASLLAMLNLGSSPGKRLAESTILETGVHAFAPTAELVGRLVSETPAPAEFLFSPAIVEVRGARWRPISDFAGHEGVVYDLPGPSGEFASLYVIKAESDEEMPDAPSLRPMVASGCCASAWREGNLLYVLVVEGDAAAYRAYVKAASGPVA